MSVASTANLGKGFPDIIVGLAGKNFLLEIKSGEGKLSPDEKEWHQHWSGQVAVVRSLDDCLIELGMRTRL
jgi:hypothetical protein